MKWLEIIEVRTANRITQELKRSLEELISGVKQEQAAPKINVFSSFTVEGDLSVHLTHNMHKPIASGSVLGIRIADALRAFGMVNHQIWCGVSNKKNQKKN